MKSGTASSIADRMNRDSKQHAFDRLISQLDTELADHYSNERPNNELIDSLLVIAQNLNCSIDSLEAIEIDTQLEYQKAKDHADLDEIEYKKAKGII